jgi:hypothetical protein
MKNPLSDIYANKILLQEGKDNVVVEPGKQEIAKGGKVPVTKAGGDEKVKKDIPKAQVDSKHSDEGKESKQAVKEEIAHESAFEKLFKATLKEDLGQDIAMDMSMPPTDNEGAAEEILDTEDEASDLVVDLKTVIDSLQSILDKIGNEESSEESDGGEEMEDEVGDDMMEDSLEHPVEEGVESEDKGHALHNLKAGTELQKPGSKEVKGAVPVSKGKANGGKIDSDDKLKPAKSFDKSLQNPKSKPEVSSTIKTGDFFKS